NIGLSMNSNKSWGFLPDFCKTLACFHTYKIKYQQKGDLFL
ncbi:hypothetical protein HMPREF2738_01719, partial [Clostridiales bacterium KLE1615]